MTSPGPSSSKRLSAHDASYLYGESIAGPLHVGTIAVVEGEIPFARLSREIALRLPEVPRYRQRLHFVPFNLAHASWEDDPYFDIRNHVRRRQVADGSQLEHAIAVAVRDHEAILNRSRPLWEVHVVEGVPGKTVVLTKVHHCLVDGEDGVDLANVLFDTEPEPRHRVVEENWQPRPLPSIIDAVMGAMREGLEAQAAATNAIASAIAEPETAAQEAAELAEASRTLRNALMPAVTATPWNNGGLVTSRRQLARVGCDSAAVEALAAELGATTLDVLIAIAAEAATRYLQARAARVTAPDLRIGVPVQRSTGPGVSMVFPVTSARPMEARERCLQVANECARARDGGHAQALDQVMQAAEMMPATVMGMASLVSMTTVDAISSMAAWSAAPGKPGLSLPSFGVNFIASAATPLAETRYLAGHQVLEVIGLLPLAGTLGYGVAMTNYAGRLELGLMAEPRLMPDLDRMRGLVEEVARELCVLSV